MTWGRSRAEDAVRVWLALPIRSGLSLRVVFHNMGAALFDHQHTAAIQVHGLPMVRLFVLIAAHTTAYGIGQVRCSQMAVQLADRCQFRYQSAIYAPGFLRALPLCFLSRGCLTESGLISDYSARLPLCTSVLEVGTNTRSLVALWYARCCVPG